MSSYKITYAVLTCDHPGCTAEFTDHAGATNAKVRPVARRAGWTYIPGHPSGGGNQDLCPTHKPAR